MKDSAVIFLMFLVVVVGGFWVYLTEVRLAEQDARIARIERQAGLPEFRP